MLMCALQSLSLTGAARSHRKALKVFGIRYNNSPRLFATAKLRIAKTANARSTKRYADANAGARTHVHDVLAVVTAGINVQVPADAQSFELSVQKIAETASVCESAV
jgi:hypothetical protein